MPNHVHRIMIIERATRDQEDGSVGYGDFEVEAM